VIAITFYDFYHRNYKKGNFSLYVLRDGKTVLYVGISKVDIWDRWFGNLTPHMEVFKTEKHQVFRGNTRAGRSVAENYPESIKWTVELWTVDDCKEYLLSFGVDKTYLSDLLSVEREMIRQRKPLYNVQNSVGGSDMPRTKKEKELFRKQAEIYNSIFNK
jgi:hypothetical protein